MIYDLDVWGTTTAPNAPLSEFVKTSIVDAIGLGFFLSLLSLYLDSYVQEAERTADLRSTLFKRSLIGLMLVSLSTNS